MVQVMNAIREWLHPVEIPLWRYYLRLLLVVAQLVLAYCLAGHNSPFFYQAF